MVDLNKNGWSTKEMIFLSSILVVFFFIAIVNMMKMYHAFTEEENNNQSKNNQSSLINSYQDIENYVLEAGIEYYNTYYNSESDVKISVSKMKKQGFINNAMLKPEEEDQECTGYVQILDDIPKAYIKCQKYKSEYYKE